MAIGDRPLMTSALKATWEKETTFGQAETAGTWNTFGARKGEIRTLGPNNTWEMQRHWNGDGREGDYVELVQQDYGGRLGEFKVTDPVVLGFWWGQEPSAPSQIGATSYYRHTAVPSDNDPQDSMNIQIHMEDADANAIRPTYLGCIVNELEVSMNEGLEVSYAPTLIGQDVTRSVGEATHPTVSATASPTFRHFHGDLQVYGESLIRINSARLRFLSGATRQRYWNQTQPLLANEYPLEQVQYVVTARAYADARQFSSFSNKDIHQLASDGDIGQAQLKAIETTDQNEFQFNFGSSNDAFVFVTADIIGRTEGGHLVLDLEWAGRVSEYQWVDQNASRFFSS